MPRGHVARKRRSERRTADGAAGVSKAPGIGAAVAEFPGLGTLIAAAAEGHASDCATHNAPALENGECDCEFGGNPSPGTKKDKRLKENAAMSGTCAECSHDAADHAGDDHMGACGMDECTCQGFASRDDEMDDADDTASAGRDTFLEDITRGLPTEHAETVRVRLEQFTIVERADVADTLPDEHKPGAKTPRRRPGPGSPTPVMPVAAGKQVAWEAMIVPEGKLTEDGRAMAPGSISWRELPLTLMAMIETTEGGHIGAQLCGRIDRIWRDEAAGVIRAAGVFDDGEYGSEIARLVADRTLTGVSVDLAIAAYEMGPRSDWFDADGNWAPKEQADDAEAPSAIDLLLGPADENDPIIFVVTDAVIGMTTVCPFPAFAEAKIDVASSLVAGANPGFWTVTAQAGFVMREVLAEVGVAVPATPTEAEDALTASATGAAPTKPPREWFENPGLEELTAITITDDGRIYGHAWAWDTCHTAFADVCVTAPSSETDYAYFHLGEVECDDGSRVSCGKVTFDTGHCPDPRASRAAATAHYDNTGAVGADIVVGEDEFGGWINGALRPDLSMEDVRKLRAAVLSGDWRNVTSVKGGGNLELVALLAVNVPGFPVPRGPRAEAVVASGHTEVLSLVAAGIHRGMPETDDLADSVKERLAALAARATVRRDEFADRFAALASRVAGE